MAAPAGNVITGLNLANGATSNAPNPFPVSKRNIGVAVTVYSHYAATAATTGVDLLVAYSIDGGLTYSDPASLGIPTTPTPSSVSAVTSQKVKTILNDGSYVTHIQFSVKNLDGTNHADDVEVLAIGISN